MLATLSPPSTVYALKDGEGNSEQSILQGVIACNKYMKKTPPHGRAD